ncbi:MAG TPA: hypothetical protein VFM38_04340 [Candidatus Limnocylindrales bacterium]|nr:hypothetical protein [Candidatus Limnocylindrales bacterium]
MTKVLIVNHDIDLGDQEVDSLRRRGYDVRGCMGPIGAHCPILAGRECDLIDWADVVVYDAWATGEPDGAETLIAGIQAQHPGTPIVLSASGMEPSWVETTGSAAVVPLVGLPSGERLAVAIESALGRYAPTRMGEAV